MIEQFTDELRAALHEEAAAGGWPPPALLAHAKARARARRRNRALGAAAAAVVLGAAVAATATTALRSDAGHRTVVPGTPGPSPTRLDEILAALRPAVEPLLAGQGPVTEQSVFKAKGRSLRLAGRDLQIAVTAADGSTASDLAADLGGGTRSTWADGTTFGITSTSRTISAGFVRPDGLLVELVITRSGTTTPLPSASEVERVSRAASTAVGRTAD
ncbi:MAG TPA: hypothetical protein VHE83_15820 [Mycobacteriales bacterium]|nr:hypothetical protein [Mycobacteriales bacterium]